MTFLAKFTKIMLLDIDFFEDSFLLNSGIKWRKLPQTFTQNLI